MNRSATTWRINEVALQSVREVTQLLSNAAEPRAALPAALDCLCDRMEFDDAAIGLVDPQAHVPQTHLQHVRSLRKPEHPQHMPQLLDEAWASIRNTAQPWIVESEWGEAVADAATALCTEADLDRSAVAVPIEQAGSVCGVLCIERIHGPGDQAEFCFDADVRSLLIIARLVAASERTIHCAAAAARPTTYNSKPRRNEIVGQHPRLVTTIARTRRAAASNATVVLRGESGTGKELLAKLLHETSPRRSRPFVPVNCAALSDGLIESELFGHEKGAFTGAISQRKGRFELAHGGTLFLDEIGEISGTFQATLLRALQLGEFERVGGTTTLKVDVRVVAATHRNLEREVRSGRFRADLYYRLAVIQIQIPALRERTSDIHQLAHLFLARFNAENGTDYSLSASCLPILSAYPFPGNVRELENSIYRAASLCTGTELTATDFDWLQSSALRRRKRALLRGA